MGNKQSSKRSHTSTTTSVSAQKPANEVDLLADAELSPLPAQNQLPSLGFPRMAYAGTEYEIFKATLKKSYGMATVSSSKTFKDLHIATSESFAHDAGMLRSLEGLLFGEKVYTPPHHGRASIDVFPQNGWSDVSQRPQLAWAWITEVVLAASRGSILYERPDAFDNPKAAKFCPPSYVVAPDGSTLIVWWQSQTPTGRSLYNGPTYSRYCMRFSDEGHFEGDIHEASFSFNLGPHGGAPEKAKQFSLSDLPAAKKPLPESLRAITPAEAAEAEQKEKEAKAEKERLEKEAKEAEERKIVEDKQRRLDEIRQRVLKYFNPIDDETLALLSQDMDSTPKISLQYNQGQIYEAKSFPGMYVLIDHPNEDSPRCERRGFIWKGKWSGIVSYMSANCSDIMASAGWTANAPEELKFRLMTEMIHVLRGGDDKSLFLEEEPEAFKKHNIPIKFEPVWFLKRGRFDCWWIHFWTHQDHGHCHFFNRVSFGFLGDTGEFQGAWTQRLLRIMFDGTFEKVLDPLKWASGDCQVNGKDVLYTGEESWPMWKKEMTPEK